VTSHTRSSHVNRPTAAFKMKSASLATGASPFGLAGWPQGTCKQSSRQKSPGTYEVSPSSQPSPDSSVPLPQRSTGHVGAVSVRLPQHSTSPSGPQVFVFTDICERLCRRRRLPDAIRSPALDSAIIHEAASAHHPSHLRMYRGRRQSAASCPQH
jgi:hypothetical protein